MEQTKLAQGDYARTADGTANTMKTLSAQFEDAKVAIGQALMPAFSLLLGAIENSNTSNHWANKVLQRKCTVCFHNSSFC